MDENAQFWMLKAGSPASIGPVMPSAANNIKVDTNLFLVDRANSRVGIMTGSPLAKLDIAGNFRVNGPMAINRAVVSNQQLVIQSDGTSIPLNVVDSTATYNWLNILANGNVIMSGAGTRVGIGTAVPAVQFHVMGPPSSTNIAKFSRTGSAVAGNVIIAAQDGSLVEKSCYLQWTANVATAGGRLGIFADGGTTATMNIDAGSVGLGKVAAYQFELSTDGAAKPSTNTWTISSDERLKKDVRPFKDGLDTVKQINPVWYKYNGAAGFVQDDSKENIGVIGQEIQKVAPYTVGAFRAKLKEDDAEETELLSFNSHALPFILINAVKEQQAQIGSLWAIVGSKA